ncbi:MAG TPA: hypothetical protein VMJ31_09595 [Methylocystis sp.]|nr:hypothetical protein [Methylocystis sp.]
MIRKILLATLFVVAAVPRCGAEPPTRAESDWPCRQVKVASLSLEAIWSGPPIDRTAQADSDPALSDLVARLAARRTPLEDAQKLVSEYAQSAGAKRKERLTLLFARLYDKLDAERSQVIGGLERYGRAQKEAAQRLREETQKLREAQDARRDPAELQELSTALAWNTRMFEERRKAVVFACETPALIEQRLGALARMILAAMA